MQSQGPAGENPTAETLSAVNQMASYDAVGHYIAELYDQHETQRDDVALIQSLLGDRKVRILEPFCGHGRILLPLAEAGHETMGLDLSEQFLQALGNRLRLLSPEVQARVSYRRADVIADSWPTEFDVVILGANCLYELATPEEQEHCVGAAAASLRSGGYLYLDNNHMEGDLDPAWRQPGVQEGTFPAGVCADGTQVTATSETVWHDAPRRLARFRRTVRIQTPGGEIQEREWTQQKHPPSTGEMRGWLVEHRFAIEEEWGDRHRSPSTDDSPRAVFWAVRA